MECALHVLQQKPWLNVATAIHLLVFRPRDVRVVHYSLWFNPAISAKLSISKIVAVGHALTPVDKIVCFVRRMGFNLIIRVINVLIALAQTKGTLALFASLTLSSTTSV